MFSCRLDNNGIHSAAMNGNIIENATIKRKPPDNYSNLPILSIDGEAIILLDYLFKSLHNNVSYRTYRFYTSKSNIEKIFNNKFLRKNLKY